MTSVARAIAPAGSAPARLTPPVVPALLRRYGEATASAMDRILDRHGEAPFLGALLADYPRRGGKRMRPALCIAAARAHGAAMEQALACAAGIELFHNALLIHDDIEDESEVRRGRPTLHRLHGLPLALNAGDALLMLALQPVIETAARLGGRAGRAILDSTLAMARETAEGQALELGWRSRPGIALSEADYLALVLKKTAWLATIWPLQIGLVIGTRGRADPAAVVRFGFFLGAAFQIEDDILNFLADQSYGKERHGDLYEGKRTLILIHARQAAAPRDRDRIDAFLACARAARTVEMVEEMADLVEATGALERARLFAEALAGAAAHEVRRAFGHLPAGDDRAFLEGMVSWVFERV